MPAYHVFTMYSGVFFVQNSFLSISFIPPREAWRQGFCCFPIFVIAAGRRKDSVVAAGRRKGQRVSRLPEV